MGTTAKYKFKRDLPKFAVCSCYHHIKYSCVKAQPLKSYIIQLNVSVVLLQGLILPLLKDISRLIYYCYRLFLTDFVKRRLIQF